MTRFLLFHMGGIAIILDMKVYCVRRESRIPGALNLSVWGTLVAISLLALIACGGERDLLVFAATSLRDPLTEVSRKYEEDSGVSVDLSFGASQSLAQQIASGAPADVFISAGTAPVEFLEERNITSNDGALRLLGNELVVVMLEEGEEIRSLGSLTSNSIGRLALADPSLAPAGAYAREALQSEGVWDGLQSRLIYGKDVRAAMTYVEVGNADAGIVYRTDARSSDSLDVVHTVAPTLHSTIVYPAVAINDSSNREDIADYLDFLSSGETIDVFRRFGFSDPPPK